MIKFMQKIVFFVTMITFANAASAVQWPVFSTANVVEGQIALDQAINAETEYDDSTYSYSIDPTSPYLLMINLYIQSKALPIQLVPTIEDADENEMPYNILLNNSQVGQINISRAIDSWPVFSVTNIAEKHIELKSPFTLEQKYQNTKHQYSFDFLDVDISVVKACIDARLNVQFKPSDEPSVDETKNYNVFINDIDQGQINVTRGQIVESEEVKIETMQSSQPAAITIIIKPIPNLPDVLKQFEKNFLRTGRTKAKKEAKRLAAQQ